MSNTSATGGYLLSTHGTLPGSLTFENFIQQVLVGVTGLTPLPPPEGARVRVKWQVEVPKQLPLETNWLSFAFGESDADTFPYNGIDTAGNNYFQRMESFTIQCSFYGPQAFEYVRILRNGLCIGQNREVLQSAKMDFVNTGKAIHVPDLVNERFVNRWELPCYFRREILEVYPILTFLTASGTLYVEGSTAGVRETPINVSED